MCGCSFHQPADRATAYVPGSVQSMDTTTSTGKAARRSGYVVEPVREGELWNETVGPYGYRVTKKEGEQSQYRYWPYT